MKSIRHGLEDAANGRGRPAREALAGSEQHGITRYVDDRALSDVGVIFDNPRKRARPGGRARTRASAPLRYATTVYDD